MESLKIAFVSDKSAPMYFGGYEIRLLELANRMSSKGHEVKVYTTAPHEFTTPEGAHFYPSFPHAFQNGVSGKRSLMHSSLFSLSLSSNPMGVWKPDFLIVQAIPYLHLFFMRRWVRKLDSVKIVDVSEAWKSHKDSGTTFGGASSFISRRLLTIGLGFSDFVMANSNVTARSLEQNYGVEAGRLVVLPNGVDIDLLKGFAASARTSYQEKVYDFVTTGRLVEVKRHSDFIDALSLLKRNYGWNGKAAIVGSGPLEQQLVNRAIRQNVYSNIEFKGFLDDEQKVNTLALSKVFVLPSEREGFSIATLEAMALGLPVIVARPQAEEVFGPSEFVTEGKNGLYYPVGDTVALGDCMDRLLNSSSDMMALGSNGEEAASSYDWKGLINIFERKLKDSRTARAERV